MGGPGAGLVYRTRRQALVIGEAIKKIPVEIIDQHHGVSWKEFAGMRDKMVHGYFSISPMIMWETIQYDLSPLANPVKELLREIE